ncbi:MAG: hypothetical protein IJT59_03360 [Desulfovibrionaceae bacterium]|nr:hypothetical protein [Desulfovibrionaceae bacterium]
MKIALNYDGQGSFAERADPTDDKSFELMLSQVGQGIGQGLLFYAQKKNLFLGRDLSLTLEAATDLDMIRTEGINLTVSAKIREDLLDEIVQKAVQHSFPSESSPCPIKISINSLDK